MISRSSLALLAGTALLTAAGARGRTLALSRVRIPAHTQLALHRDRAHRSLPSKGAR
jgi:hypothetical protein